MDRDGTVVGQLARSFKGPTGMRCTFATVYGIVTRDRERTDPQYQTDLHCDKWEVVVPELVFEPESQTR